MLAWLKNAYLCVEHHVIVWECVEIVTPSVKKNSILTYQMDKSFLK